MQILVLTAYTGPKTTPYVGITIPVMWEYCKANNYGFLCIQDGFEKERPLQWSKVKFVREQLPSYEWVVWLDADILVMNHTVRLETIIEKHAGAEMLVAKEVFTGQCIPPQHRENVNTGVMFFKNTRRITDFLTKWWNETSYINHWWHEQGALHEMLKGDYKHFQDDYIKVCDQKEFNSMIINDSYTPGDFILHMAGIGHDITLERAMLLFEMQSKNVKYKQVVD